MTQSVLAHRLHAYWRLMRFDKPIGIWLLLWPALWAVWIASDGRPRPNVFVVFVLGTIVMRAAGCVINDFADRRWDGAVKRTRDRPLATGEVSEIEALVLFIALMGCALMLAMMLNGLALLLAGVGAILALVYPFLKRVSDWPQLGLGLAFAWSIPMAFAAQQGHLSWTAWALFLIVVAWTVAYDTEYAMADREEDLRIGIRSSAIRLGQFDCLVVSALQLFVLLGLALLALLLDWSNWFWWGWLVAAAFMLYQQWLIRDRDSEKCFRAFLNNRYVGGAIFFGLWAHYQFVINPF